MGLDFPKHCVDGAHLIGEMRVAYIDEMDQEVGFDNLFQRCLERFDQCMRQLFDKSDGVREQHLLLVRQKELACGWIEGGKELVRGKNVRTGKEVEKGRFSRVRVTD